MAGTLILATQVYLAVGAVVALAFLTIGIGRVDPDARGSFVFRPMLIPGILLIWPLVLWRWWRLARGHRQGVQRPPLGLQQGATLLLALALPAAIAIALVVRQEGPLEAPAVRLEDPQ